MADKKPIFLLEREVAAMAEAYHELAGSKDVTVAKLEAEADKLIEAKALLSEAYCEGAKEHCKGAGLRGQAPRPGVFEISCPECGVVARGTRSQEEAVYNFNRGVFFTKEPFSEGGVTPAKAEPVSETSEAEATETE